MRTDKITQTRHKLIKYTITYRNSKGLEHLCHGRSTNINHMNFYNTSIVGYQGDLLTAHHQIFLSRTFFLVGVKGTRILVTNR